jgi:carbon storage regulator
MLVLSRKRGEALMIGDDVVVTVVSVEGGRVRIGISAPPGTGVWRSELIEGQAAAKRGAAAAKGRREAIGAA